MKTADTISIECHLPERRRRTEIRMCHGSCCCCCCCLHTAGGIVGAALAPARGDQSTAWSHLSIIENWEEEDHEPGTAIDQEAITGKMPSSPRRPALSAGAMPNIARRGMSAVKVYWLLSLAASIVGALIGATQGNNGFIVGLILLLLTFPVVQLICAFITGIWVVFSSRPDRSFQLKQVRRLASGLFLGTLAGLLAMLGIGFLIAVTRK